MYDFIERSTACSEWLKDSMFSETVKKALIEAGWTPNRKIDITQYENALINIGYDVPKVLKDFLTEFGGLYLKTPHLTEPTPELLKEYPLLRKRSPYQILHFDVMDAIMPGEVPMSKEEIFEPRVGEDMILFGEIWDGRYRLYMTPLGKLYARTVDSILFLGNNYIEMLENEYNRVRVIEIP